MASISDFVKLLSTAPPVQRVQLLTVVVVTMLAFAALYFSGLKVYTAPDLSRLIAIEGRVSGYPGSWEHNRSLVHFAVAYKLEGKREGKPIYMYRELYEHSGLRINSKVSLTVERLEEGSVVRALATQDGRILYDDRFNQQVIAWNNQSIRATVVMSVLISFVIAVMALITVLRNRRHFFPAD